MHSGRVIESRRRQRGESSLDALRIGGPPDDRCNVPNGESKFRPGAVFMGAAPLRDLDGSGLASRHRGSGENEGCKDLKTEHGECKSWISGQWAVVSWCD